MPLADSGSKRLVGLAPNARVQWITQRPDVVAEGIIEGESQWISRETDALVRVFSPREGHFLVLTEIQLRYNERMPRQMQAHAALAEERYDLPFFAVLVNILPPPAGAIGDNGSESS